MSTSTVPETSTTLEQRLAEGKIPAAQALRYAIMLAEALRGLHDAGQAHGAVAPVNIAIPGAGLGLPPAQAPAPGPYTAPELLEGGAADVRSDIFSFGAVVHEMLSGRPASEAGDGTAVTEAVRASCGDPAVDRFLATCLAKDPAERFERMQKVLMELKLLAVSARRAQGPARRAEVDFRSELRQVETRVAQRIEAQEKSASDNAGAAVAAVDALRADLSALSAQFAAAQERAPENHEAIGERILARVAPDIEAIALRTSAIEQALEALGQRLTQTEQGLDGLRQAFASFEEDAAADVQEIEQNLKAQRTAIDAARTALAQTDDLVERVVEALELLQTSVMDQTEGRYPSVD